MLGLGVYPEISLKEARDKKDIARKQILAGINPSHHRKIEKFNRNEVPKILLKILHVNGMKIKN